MKKPSLPISTERERHTTAPSPSYSHPLLPRFVAWCVTAVWRTCVDWRTKCPFLTRATAHLSIITLALTTIFLSGVGIPAPQAVVGSSSDADVMPSLKIASPTEPEVTPSPLLTLSTNQPHSLDADTIARFPVPHTIIPERPRAQVITYTIQPGDNVFAVAAQFGLDVYTIIWSNREAIKDAPWLIQPGLELFIPPVDGIYHTVRAGETVASIAADYEVELAALYNEWNGLEEGKPLREGQLLVVPGGEGERMSLEPPRPQYTAAGASRYSYGVCSGVTFTGPGANGWFILPTGSPRVSGWYFHDPRNPTHIGLDYACHLGDPLYAADNGVVTIAGWNGGYGVLVEVNHGNGFITRYGHFSDIVVGCGQAVYQGQLLGYCGSTGWSSGPHLHFEIRHNGVPQDPQVYLP